MDRRGDNNYCKIKYIIKKDLSIPLARAVLKDIIPLKNKPGEVK